MKIFKNIKSKLEQSRHCFKKRIKCVNHILTSKNGSSLDTAIHIVVGIVIAAIILAGLVVILENTVMPGLTDQITSIFGNAPAGGGGGTP